MLFPQAIIFDLGGTLVSPSGWDTEEDLRWRFSYQALITQHPNGGWPGCEAYVGAMREAETAHWQRVTEEQWSGPPSGLLSNGFHHLGLQVTEEELLTALDGYAQATAGWATPFSDTHETLLALRREGYQLGLLSNTWWAAQWHNAHLALHSLDKMFDAVVYTSDLPHSKPHPLVFLEVTSRLGVEPQACVMVGDTMIEDISGALTLGMRAVWKRNETWLRPAHIAPTATITYLSELPPLLQLWQTNKAEASSA